MKVTKPVYALWCGPGCGTDCRTVKGMLDCLTPDPCRNCA